MNTEIRKRIKQMNNEGIGYKKIAKELGLASSTVRYVCVKLGDEDLLDGNCEHCGLKIKSIKGKKKKRFCSDKCRWQWWNAHHNEVDRKAFSTHHCKYCGQEFTSYGNSKRIYCSHECYIKFKLNKGANGHGTL